MSALLNDIEDLNASQRRETTGNARTCVEAGIVVFFRSRNGQACAGQGSLNCGTKQPDV